MSHAGSRSTSRPPNSGGDERILRKAILQPKQNLLSVQEFGLIDRTRQCSFPGRGNASLARKRSGPASGRISPESEAKQASPNEGGSKRPHSKRAPCMILVAPNK